MTHIVGSQLRNEFVLDPVQSLRQGAALDRMGPILLPRRPIGVMRAPHHVFNELDDQRQLALARLVNGQPSPVP